MRIFIITLLCTLILVPYVSSAACPTPATPGVAVPTRCFATLVDDVLQIVQKLIAFIFVFTFITFMWGVIKGWVIQGGSEEGVESGKKVVFAGIVAFVVMSSVWGILYILKSSIFGI